MSTATQAQAPPKMLTLLTDTTRVDDSRRSIFIEVRERGADSVVARSLVAHQRQRGNASRRDYGAYHYNPAAESLSGISFLDDIAASDFVEVYIPSAKSQAISVKKTKMTNVSTPYVLAPATTFGARDEVVIVSPSHVTGTTLARRQQFAADVYAIAQQLPEPIYKISALRAMEQLFLALVSGGKINHEVGERLYNKYEKISARIWRGQTEHEQVASFNLAWNALARAVGLRDASA